MRRIDKYSLEELVKSFLDGEPNTEKEYFIDSVFNDFLEYCNQEIKTVPRIATINTIEDYKKAIKEYNRDCSDSVCRLCIYSGTYHCKDNFLLEEIEVEE